MDPGFCGSPPTTYLVHDSCTVCSNAPNQILLKFACEEFPPSGVESSIMVVTFCDLLIAVDACPRLASN